MTRATALASALLGTQVGIFAVYPPEARGQDGLAIPTAKRAILTYEHTYWHDRQADVSLGYCQRHSARQVSCVVHIQRGTSTLVIRDWATRIQGAIRVHPGSSFEEVRQLS